MAAVCFACRDNTKLRMLREAENTVNNDAFEGCDNICSQVAREDKSSVRTHGCWPARTPLAKNVIAPPPPTPPQETHPKPTNAVLFL